MVGCHSKFQGSGCDIDNQDISSWLVRTSVTADTELLAGLSDAGSGPLLQGPE